MEINPEVNESVWSFMTIIDCKQRVQEAPSSPVVSVCVVSDAEHGE